MKQKLTNFTKKVHLEIYLLNSAKIMNLPTTEVVSVTVALGPFPIDVLATTATSNVLKK